MYFIDCQKHKEIRDKAGLLAMKMKIRCPRYMSLHPLPKILLIIGCNLLGFFFSRREHLLLAHCMHDCRYCNPAVTYAIKVCPKVCPLVKVLLCVQHTSIKPQLQSGQIKNGKQWMCFTLKIKHLLSGTFKWHFKCWHEEGGSYILRAIHEKISLIGFVLFLFCFFIFKA